MLEKTGSDRIELDQQQIRAAMIDIGRRARRASAILAVADADTKNQALVAMAQAILDEQQAIIEANQKDVANGEQSGMSAAFLDRLTLNPERVQAMAEGLKNIAKLADPVGRTLAKWTQPNGLEIERISTPLGVIGVIYESRPNVTADAGALCLKAGNAVILRGGSDSYYSSRAIHAAMTKGLEQTGLPVDAIQTVPTTDRMAVGEMLKGLDSNIDVIVPRGGKGLVSRVQNDARVPVFAHLEGICHIYIDETADLDMAIDITVNSKMRRTGICGAAETLLIDKAVAETHLTPILDALVEKGCSIRADQSVQNLYQKSEPATESDWQTEYLDAIISVAIIDGVDGAIDHINRHSSNHTESIISESPENVERFFKHIDSAILLHNASTQYADGGEFGMGAEIGIATGKMHARGPVGVEQLTSFKYLVRGNGQTRP